MSTLSHYIMLTVFYRWLYPAGDGEQVGFLAKGG